MSYKSQLFTCFNYVYFGLFFLCLISFSAGGIFLKENLAGSRAFFFAYAMGQSVAEVAFLSFITHLLQTINMPWLFCGWISLTFCILIFHFCDFFLERILDLSLAETVDFVLDESWGNFLYLLDASGMPLWLWFSGFFLILFLPFLGLIFYRVTNRISRLHPIFARREWLLQTFTCIPLALLFWEHSAISTILPPNVYTSFVKTLPWKSTFLEPQNTNYPLQALLKPPMQEEDILEKIALAPTKIRSKPNIYLFVVESFRDDFIQESIAPHLLAFKQGSFSSSHGLSNGNGSHLGWFSIFHSQFPYHWRSVRQSAWQIGAPALNLLKKWGYQIHLYTSAQLNYFGMEEVLFGKEAHLIDAYHTFHHPAPLPAYESDQKTVEAFIEDFQNPAFAEGQLVIFFWDATHFNYSWPQKMTLFSPVAHEIAYFQPFFSEARVEEIKNRYRNAVHFVDTLFEQFLKEIDLNRSIVVVTGDHGEEFFEHGNLFHNSHLTKAQTNIPLYMKFPGSSAQQISRPISQMDIFPSIIDFLSDQAPLDCFEGCSIFSECRWPFAVIARFNAGRTPYEFCLHDGEHKMIARFDNRSNIFESKNLHIRSMSSALDQPIFQSKTKEWVEEKFHLALERMFPKKES